MVPVFTASGPEEQQTQRTPARISDEAIRQEEQLAKPSTSRSPMIMYGVLGGVLLALGVGLKFYLDQSWDEQPFNTPLDPIVPIVDGEDGSETAAVAQEPGDSDSADAGTLTATGARLAPLMIQASRITINRDKALCRRLTADVFLRLGQLDDAEKEFRQLLVVARQRNRADDYYRVEPRVRHYWRLIRQKDLQGAQAALAAATDDSRTIPAKGLLAIQATISLAAALINDARTEEARQLLAHHDYDQTVRAELDDLHRHVWDTMAASLNTADLESLSPFRCLLWTDPLVTAVAVELSIHQRWELAVNWALQQADASVQGDTMAEIARHLLRVDAPTVIVESLRQAAASLSTSIRLRTEAVLARVSDECFDDVSAELAALNTAAAATVPNVGDMLGLRPADQTTSQQFAEAFGQLAVAAVRRQSPEQAVRFITAVYGQLTQDIAPTADVRETSQEMDSHERRVEDRIRQHLGLSESADVRSQFRRYRRGLDRLAAAAEARRRFLVNLLAAFAADGGAETLVAAIESSESLANELTIDPLCRLVAAEARFRGAAIPQLADVAAVRVRRGRRTAADPKELIATLWLDTVHRLSEDTTGPVFHEMQDGRLPLPGLRSCLMRRSCEHLAAQGELKALDLVKQLTSDVLRENSLWSVCLWLARADLAAEVEARMNVERMSPIDRVMACSGIITGLSDEIRGTD